MNSENLRDDRDDRFRDVLVALAHKSPLKVRRLRYRPIAIVVASSVAAFALAGALTGGAVASSAAESAQQATAVATARFDALQVSERLGGTTIGDPIVESASRELTISPASAPAKANNFVFGFACVNAGRFRIEMDSPGDSSTIECTPADINSPKVEHLGFGSSIYDPKNTYVKVTSHSSARFTIWFSWVTVAPQKASSQERADLADGTITRAELTDAVDREAACMTGLGFSARSTSVSASSFTPWFFASTTAAAHGAEVRCYEEQASGVERKWFSEVMAGTVAANSVVACLRERGVEPAGTPAARAAQLSALDQNFQTTCSYKG